MHKRLAKVAGEQRIMAKILHHPRRILLNKLLIFNNEDNRHQDVTGSVSRI